MEMLDCYRILIHAIDHAAYAGGFKDLSPEQRTEIKLASNAMARQVIAAPAAEEAKPEPEPETDGADSAGEEDCPACGEPEVMDEAEAPTTELQAVGEEEL